MGKTTRKTPTENWGNKRKRVRGVNSAGRTEANEGRPRVRRKKKLQNAHSNEEGGEKFRG